MALFSLIKDPLVRILVPKLQSPLLCPIFPKYSDRGDDPDRPEPRILQLIGEEARVREGQLRKCKIVVRGSVDYSLISGVPVEITCGRLARIHQPPKNPMQSGTRHLGHWLLDFDTKERWENPNMGWCSSGDAVSNVQMRFATKQAAIDYCKRNQMTFWVQQDKTKKKFKVKNYGENFHHKNRTRLSTK
ncbi:NADH dehydrogenase [ubiquinone] iron-sulfur protein 4, mitochondrial-like [Anthonomus grandis grandis]|uniref:NADH dehydrogenase [ubiquinone] iron-sulfur protein 4, mitochondrial-like n=1 Tax=Anthonomus grandis grandis TaxID=2921223 RepID=UPI0021658164|nr:NADH dehydrogenase [ubiquinone] iron-sulfur protein 4, mitochondrial-like [Anthonomus grandis grandis]